MGGYLRPLGVICAAAGNRFAQTYRVGIKFPRLLKEFGQPLLVFELEPDPAVLECEPVGKAVDRLADLSVP